MVVTTSSLKSHCRYLSDMGIQALPTQRLHIISAAKARHFYTFVCSHWTQQLQIQKRRDGTHGEVKIYVFFSMCFPWVPNFLEVYGFSYNELWLRSWPNKHPGKWQSYVFCPEIHSYMINICKQSLAFTRGEECCFPQESSLVLVMRANGCSATVTTTTQ